MPARKTKQLNHVTYTIDCKGKLEILPNGRVGRSKDKFYYEVNYSTGGYFRRIEFTTRTDATNFINEIANIR